MGEGDGSLVDPFWSYSSISFITGLLRFLEPFGLWCFNSYRCMLLGFYQHL